MPLLQNAVKSKYNVGELRINDVQLRFAEILPLALKLQWGFTCLGILLPSKQGKKLMLRDRTRVLHILNLRTTSHKKKISQIDLYQSLSEINFVYEF